MMMIIITITIEFNSFNAWGYLPIDILNHLYLTLPKHCLNLLPELSAS